MDDASYERLMSAFSAYKIVIPELTWLETIEEKQRITRMMGRTRATLDEEGVRYPPDIEERLREVYEIQKVAYKDIMARRRELRYPSLSSK
jgi:hypothetical protein